MAKYKSSKISRVETLLLYSNSLTYYRQVIPKQNEKSQEKHHQVSKINKHDYIIYVLHYINGKRQ